MATTFTNGIGDDFAKLEAARAPQDPGLLSRAVYHVLEAPQNIEHGLRSSIATMLGSPKPVDTREVPLKPAQGAAEFITDMAFGGLLPMAGEVALTGGIGRAAGLARLAETRPLLASIANDALAFGVLGAQDDAVTGIEQAAEGAGYGALRYLPKVQRIIPAALLGMGSEAFWDRDGETPIYGDSDISQGDVAGVLGPLTATLIGGKLPWERVPNPSPSANVTKFLPSVRDESGIANYFAGEGDVFQNIQQRPRGDEKLRMRYGYDPAAAGDPALFQSINQRAGYSAADAADTFIEQMLPKKEYIPPQPMVEPVLTGKSALRSAQVMDINVETPKLARQKGKLASLPESMRTTGGSVDPALLGAIARTTGGAAIGAAASPDEVDPMMGALFGAAAANMPAALRRSLGFAQEHFAPVAKQNNAGSIRDPHAVVPAIKVGDKTIKGMKGDTHRDILNRHMAANPDDVDALMNFDSKTNPNFFLDAEGNPISRETLQSTLGVKSSQELRDIQTRTEGKSRFEQDLELPGMRSTYEAELAHMKPKTDAQILQHLENQAAMIKLSSQDIQVTDTLTIPAKKEVTPTSRVRAGMYYAEAKKRRLAVPDSPLLDSYIGNQGKLATLAKDSSEGGYVYPELQATMARAAVGGLAGGAVGGIADGQEGALAGAAIGAATLGFGPAIARATLEGISKIKASSPSGKPSVPKSWTSLAKNWGQNIEEASGRALATSAKASDRFLRFLDKSLELTMPTVVKQELMKSRGAASHLLDQMDSALTKVSLRFKPDQSLKDLAMRHLDGSIDFPTFKQQVETAYPGDVNTSKFADFIGSGREAVNGLQRMVASGIAEPGMRKVINDSIGKYLTRSYKIFTDPKWEPSIQSIDNLVTEIHSKGIWGNASPADIRTGLEQYVREAKQSKDLYSKSFSSGMGEKINQSVLKERKDLSDAWRQFLGEISDPTERLYQTVFRLRPMAEASRYFDQLSTVKEDGWLPHRFANYVEKDAFESRLLQELQNANNDADRAVAQSKVDKFRLKWQGAQNVENHPKFGSLQGNVVTRNVWDTLGTFDSLTNPASPLLRSIAGAHTAIKLARTAFNPITVVRNFVTMPMFAMIAKAAPQDMAEAWSIMRDVNHPLRSEIMKNGIGNVDQVKTEFFKEFENVTGGKYNFGNIDMQGLGLGAFDLDVAGKYANRGVRNWLDVYRLPDNMVRIGSYLSAKRRFAQELGRTIDDPDVINRAISFTNRYTMNYDTVAPAIKVARQMPFINMFISYTAEMTRILKNLGQDLVSGTGPDGIAHSRMYAAAPLSMLAVLPELLQSSAESELSPKDQADWEKAKKLMPSYARTRYRVGLSRDAQGQFHYTDVTPLIASDALNQTVKAIVGGDWKAAMAVNPIANLENTPAVNIVTSQVSGKDLHTLRDFRGLGDRVASVAKEVLPPWAPGIGSEAQRFSQAHTLNDEGQQGITNQKTGNRLTPGDFWLPYWTGVKTGGVNLSVLEQRAVSEAKRDIANEVTYLNDVLKSDTNAEVKQQMIERAKTAIASIQEKLRLLVEK